MPLTECVECRYPVADSSISCPRCGCSFVRRTPFFSVLGTLLCLLAGLAAAIHAIESPTPQATAWAGVACFCGIVARVFQADWHRTVPK